MGSHRDWSSISLDVLEEIAVKVPLIEDFMAFRGVFCSWRVAGSMDKFKPPQPSVPLLMLPGNKNGNVDDEREFYSLSRKKICIRLPLPETTLKRCLGVGFGWLLIVASSGDVSLLNPFSGAKIQLPKFYQAQIQICKNFSLKDSEQMLVDSFKCIARALLSADPSQTSNFILLASFNDKISLGFWKDGDKLWSEIESSDTLPCFADIAYYKEKFYAVDYLASAIWVWDPFAWVWDPFRSPNPTKAEMMCGLGFPGLLAVGINLVESTHGELLLITSDYKDRRSVVQIRIIDVMNRRCELIVGLGNDAVFVGYDASTSVAASAFPESVEPNHIYFTTHGFDYPPGATGYSDGEGESKNMGTYNLKDGSTEWLVVNEPLDHICPPVWIAPSF